MDTHICNIRNFGRIYRVDFLSDSTCVTSELKLVNILSTN
jgi:hypothetical protein